MSNETLTVTETIVLAPGGDTDLDSVIDPGETVRITVHIANNSTNPGETVATGLQFSQILDGMTLVDQAGNDVNVSPIAFDDAYTAIGNTLLEVGNATAQTGPQSSVAGHVTDNDLEFFGDTVEISAVQGQSTVVGNTITATGSLGGTITMVVSGAEMGAFTYLSAAGVTGAETFTYTIRDKGLDGVAGNGDDLTSTATVTVTSTAQVWYVDSSFAGTSTGTSTNPYKSLSDVSGAAGADGDGDIIYLHTGTGDYTGGIALLNNQTLHGAGTTLNVGGFELAAAGIDATITNAAGNGVTLAGNNTLTGFTVGDTTGYDIANTTTASVGTLNVSNVVLNGTGGLFRADSGGTLNVVLESASTTAAGANGILINNADSSSFTVGGTTTIADATSDGIAISNSQNSTFTFGGEVTILNDGGAGGDGVDLQSNNAGDSTFNFNGGVDITVNGVNAYGFRAQSSGVVNILDPIGTNQITSNNGTALFVNPTQFQAALSSVTAGDGGTGDGIHLEGVTGSGVTIGTVNITGVGGDGLDVTNSSANITIAGGTIGGTTAANDANGIQVDINGGSGNVTIGATVGDASAANDLIEVTGRTGGTIDFNGGLSSASGGGVDINGNAGGTVRFDGGMNLSTGAQAAFNASGNSNTTVVVTDTPSTSNVLATTTGTALNVSSTTIGAEDLTFLSISSNGAANGIVLNGTGSSGGLIVTGDGGGSNNGSGGTIQSSSGDGVLLTNTEDVRLAYMNISNNLGDGIGGSGVNGLVFNRLNVSGNGNDAASDESGINLVQVTGTASGGARPTLISNSSITNNNEFEVQIANSSGTLTNFQFLNNTVSSNGAPINGNGSSPHGNLFNFLGTGSSTMGLTVSGGSFTGNWNAASPPATIVGTGVRVDSGGTAMTANVSGATFTNNNVGIDVSTSNASTSLTFDLNGNTITGSRAQAINSFHNGNAPFTRTVNGTIQNNVIGNVTADSGSYLGRGIDIANEGAINLNLRIANNQIQNIRSFEAIGVVVGLGGQATGGGTTNLTITGNTISNIMGSRGILVDDNQVTDIGSPPGAGPFPTIFANISGNTFSGTIAGQAGNGQFMRIDQDFGTVRVTQAAPTAAAVAGELDDANGFNNSPTIRTSIGGTVLFNQGTPTLPTTNPLPLQAGEDTAPPPGDGGTGGDPVVDQPPVGEQPADGGDGGTAPPPADPVPDSSVIVDDGFLSQAELDFFVDAAKQRWAATGLTAEQSAALDGLTFSVVNMSGQWLGSFDNGTVTLDSDGAGRGWFADATPLEDSEFAHAASATRLVATAGTAAAGRFDVLTTVLHEMGHALGLADLYDAGSRDELLYAYLFAGERRLPGTEADGATPGAITHEAFAGSVIQVLPTDGTGGLFNLPPGRSVDIQWDATVDLQSNGLIVNPQNSGTVTATNPPTAFPDATSNVVTTALDTLTLGGTVWFDNGAGGGVAGNGVKDGTEPGVGSVALSLFVDADGNDVPDTPGTALLTATTAGNGDYSFAGLAPGNYIVRVDAANFTGGGALVNRSTTAGELDPDNDSDNDDNGYLSGGAVFGHTITLAYNAEPGGDTNLTLDFGFAVANQLPAFAGLDATPSFTEGGAAAVLDGNATVSDPDLTGTNYAGATLTLARSGGADAADLFGTSGTLAFSGADVLVGATTVGSFTQSGGTLVITFNASATQALVNATLQALTYSNTSDDPPATATIAYVFSDGNSGAQGIGGAGIANGSVTVSITAVDDAGVAVDDPGNSIAENATANIAVLANDSDPDDPLSVAEVDGMAITAGGTVTLASGATVKLEANGTLTYDPNGKFNYLISTTTQGTTQAVNSSATDNFTYKLTGGGTATVGMTVTGVDGAGDQLWGNSGTNTITGTPSGDVFNLSQGGEDTATGLGSNDGFYLGAALSAGDVLDGGAGSDDQLGLQGNYGSPFVLAATHLTNIETLALLPGNDARFGDTSGALYSYNLATIDANVGAGQKLTVNFNSLRAGENVIFDGSAESDGWFFTFGGLGNDTVIGGDQDDGFYFGNNGRWGALDSVDGGAGNDQLGLQGSYTVAFGAGQLTGIETIALLTGGDTRFGNLPGIGYSYDLTMDDGNVANGATMIVNANTLRAGVSGVSDETLAFDGSAESDGHYTIYSGAAADTITGGQLDDTIYGAGGADLITGGGGNDTFAYINAAHSTGAAMDQILDFAAGDTIDLSAIDAIAGGANNAFSFIGAAAFGNIAGQLRAFDAGGGVWHVEGDTDGNGIADLVIAVTTGVPLTLADFAV